MRLGRFNKAAADRRRVVVEYEDWLNLDETILAANVTAPVDEDALYVDGFVVSTNKKQVIFYVSGGTPLVLYDVTIEVLTSKDQTKSDWITFAVI